MFKNISALQFYYNDSYLPRLPFLSLLTSKLEEDFLYMAYADIMAKVTCLISFAYFVEKIKRNNL